MITRKILLKMIGVALAAAFILSACNTAASVAPASSRPSAAALALPALPAATATSVPVATETSPPTITATPTAAATATPTVQPVAQVVPNVNAYCRKGPGTAYEQVTILNSGTAYSVIGRNDLNTWWLVQLWGDVTCWTGAPGTTQLGPVAQAPVVLAVPALLPPAMPVGSYVCSRYKNINVLDVTISWGLVDGATGYRLFRNGVALSDLGPTVTSYLDDGAPIKTDLVYELEALNAAGSTAPSTVMILGSTAPGTYIIQGCE